MCMIIFLGIAVRFFVHDTLPGSRFDINNILHVFMIDRWRAGVYILQNTMVVVGGGKWLLGKKMKTEGVGGKFIRREKEKTA